MKQVRLCVLATVLRQSCRYLMNVFLWICARPESQHSEKLVPAYHAEVSALPEHKDLSRAELDKVLERHSSPKQSKVDAICKPHVSPHTSGDYC